MPPSVPAVRASRRAVAAAAARHAASARRQLSGTARTASPDRLATDAAKSPEDVMALISSITANLTRRLATSDDGSKATNKRLSPAADAARAHPDAPMLSRTASFADVFPSTSSSQGLGVHATANVGAANAMPRIGVRPGRGSTASLAAAARNILPSFTPEPAHNAANLFRLPPPPPHARRAQGLYKLQTLAASPDLLAPPPVPGATPGGNVGLARLGRPGSAVATRLGAPETVKIDLDFLEPRPAQAEADKSAELASKALAEWDQLIVDMQKHTLDAPAAAAAGNDPLAGLENIAAAAAPRKRTAAAAADRSAPHQAPNLSSLARHLATTATTTAETAATAEPTSEAPRPTRGRSCTCAPFLDTLFRYLPTPPPAILGAALAAARHLGDAHLAYAVLAQLRSATRGNDDSSGIVAMLRAADASVFGELLKTAWDVERSVPRMARILRDMDAVGLRPDRNSRMFLEQVLASAPVGSSPLATGQPVAPAVAPASEDDAVDQLVAGLEAALGTRDAKVGVEKAVGATASFEDAQMLWDTLLELDWTRMFHARPQQSQQGLPPLGGARGRARDVPARELAGLGLADLMRHGIKPAAEPEPALSLAL
ncbi:hypothetical protein AMAG_02129 [Allomyces macrogynus ATCC 38327]|uniref:Uncharacterized protein n=1 Tax=Allomyces macrogynus (strain ATCC 38327) TaxID=578462 RepID=A0A0L0S1L5_ALLM3|nr:hypothetical protein AMAG_02129 [Allomyces macrogynus ATCC 38327]|eukprot:KNE56305.1 hypothetical protein AMAG_02129 [Allomyces macrogynus ATCC 38327]